MYNGYKQCGVGGLTDELVDGHEKLAGFGEKRGAGGLEGSDLRWRRGTTRATTTTGGTLQRGGKAPGLCC